MSTLSDRKYIELQEKLASLTGQFDAWRALAATEADPLRLHRSQIAKVTGTLGELASAFKNALPPKPPANAAEVDAFLDEARNTEKMILATHSVWAFFRKKFSQRLEPGFSRFLDAADELAWVCFKPALDAAKIARKEPPLVFLGGAFSPFMVGRDKAYLPEDVPPRFLDLKEFKDLVARLPVPVIGVPWAQSGHLPDTLSVAHEVGHVVEEDVSLANELDMAIRLVVDKSRADQWLGWRGEIFADLWACAAVGPAYVSTLCDFLATDPMRDVEEKGQTGDYPTANLRVWLNLEALRLAGFTKDAKPVATLMAIWPGAAAPQKKEASAVVAALLQTEFARLGNKSVHQVLGPFGPKEFATAQGAFDALQRGSQSLGTLSTRTVFAGVRQGYDADPATWRDSGIAARMLARFDRSNPAGSLLPLGFRAAAAPGSSDAGPAKEMLKKLRELVGKETKNGD